jgi:hypothetical protein
MRGLVSLVVALCIGFLILLFAYLDWWPHIRGVVTKVAKVLFLNARMTQIQSLIATKPDVAQQT